MIVFVDNEHPKGYEQPWGEKLMANRVRIKYMLEDIAGDECLLIRWDRVTPDLLDSIEARAVFISGNSAQPDDYDVSEQAGLRAVLASRQWPAFGFCGGHQVMGQAYGVPVAPIGELDDRDEAFGEVKLFPSFHRQEYRPRQKARRHLSRSDSEQYRQACQICLQT